MTNLMIALCNVLLFNITASHELAGSRVTGLWDWTVGLVKQGLDGSWLPVFAACSSEATLPQGSQLCRRTTHRNHSARN